MFTTKNGINPYFLWELPFLTKIKGVTITSTDENLEEVGYTKNLNGAHIRAGTVIARGLCDNSGDGSHAVCKPWNTNEFCGSLESSMETLPLREYTIFCPKSIVARVLTVQILDTSPRALSFDEITVIEQSFLNRENDQERPESYNGSPGNSILIINYDLLEHDFDSLQGKLRMLFNLYISLGIPTWNGPVSRWHKQCNTLGVSQDVNQCKKVCSETVSCNAFNVDKALGNCTLRACSVPIGLPYSDIEEDNNVGYVFKGKQVT